MVASGGLEGQGIEERSQETLKEAIGVFESFHGFWQNP
jgi:hypothetical protein